MPDPDADFRAGGRDAAGSVATPVLTLELERDGFAIDVGARLCELYKCHTRITIAV